MVRPPFDVESVNRFRDAEPDFGLQRNAYALFFGTIGLMKGADRLVEVLPGTGRVPRHAVRICGQRAGRRSGEPFDAVIRRQFGERVLVVPAIRQPELLPVVAGARFVVLPSRVENLPNACLEAMALAARSLPLATRASKS